MFRLSRKSGPEHLDPQMHKRLSLHFFLGSTTDIKNPMRRPVAPRWWLLRPGYSSIRATKFFFFFFSSSSFFNKSLWAAGRREEVQRGRGAGCLDWNLGSTWVSVPLLSGCRVSRLLWCKLVAWTVLAELCRATLHACATPTLPFEVLSWIDTFGLSRLFVYCGMLNYI